MYKAKNVDTDKALDFLDYQLKAYRQLIEVEIKEKQAFLRGLDQGIRIAQQIFQCSNYEKTEKGGAGDE